MNVSNASLYTSFREILKAYRDDESGATAIEYGLIAGLIAVGMLAGVKLMGGGTAGMWTRISDAITTAMT